MSTKSLLHMKHPQIAEFGTAKIFRQTGENQGKQRGFVKRNLSGDPERGSGGGYGGPKVQFFSSASLCETKQGWRYKRTGMTRKEI